MNNGTDYQTLIDQMEDYSNNDRANDTYVGNVVGATTEDTEILKTLFTEDGKSYLTLTIAGQETNITAMIKRENVDGNTATGDNDGNEMTIYMTAEEISGSWYQSVSLEVFATVFTKEGDGEWYHIGEMYTGKANANNYSSGYFSAKNSFNTDTWTFTVNYYNLGTGKTIEELIAAYLKTL